MQAEAAGISFSYNSSQFKEPRRYQDRGVGTPVPKGRKDVDWKTGSQWPSSRIEDDHAFIFRIRISTASGGGEQRAQFSIEDVSAGRTERFTTFELAAESLAKSVQRVVSGPAGDKVQS